MIDVALAELRRKPAGSGVETLRDVAGTALFIAVLSGCFVSMGVLAQRALGSFGWMVLYAAIVVYMCFTVVYLEALTRHTSLVDVKRGSDTLQTVAERVEQREERIEQVCIKTTFRGTAGYRGGRTQPEIIVNEENVPTDPTLLEPILFHEVAHGLHNDRRNRAVVESLVYGLPTIIGLTVGWPIGMPLAIMLSFAGSFILRADSQRREYRADSYAASQTSPERMAMALATVAEEQYIESPYITRLSERLNSHPRIEHRIRALGEE